MIAQTCATLSVALMWPKHEAASGEAAVCGQVVVWKVENFVAGVGFEPTAWGL